MCSSDLVKWGPWPAKQELVKSPWVLLGPDGIQTQKNVAILQEAMHCVPCMGEGCDGSLSSDSRCIRSITVERVRSALSILGI